LRVGMPESVAQEIARSGVTPKLMKGPAKDLQVAHLFVTHKTRFGGQADEGARDARGKWHCLGVVAEESGEDGDGH
jgi:hypothetical protein